MHVHQRPQEVQLSSPPAIANRHLRVRQLLRSCFTQLLTRSSSLQMLNTSEIPGPNAGFSSAFSSGHSGAAGQQAPPPQPSAAAHADLARTLLLGLSAPLGGTSTSAQLPHQQGLQNLDTSGHHGWGGSSVDAQSVGSQSYQTFQGFGGGLVPVSAPPAPPAGHQGYGTPAASPASQASAASFWQQPPPVQGGTHGGGGSAAPLHALEASPGVARFLRGRAGSVASTDSKMSAAVMLLPPGFSTHQGLTSGGAAAPLPRADTGDSGGGHDSRGNLLGFGLGGVPGLVDGGDDTGSFFDGHEGGAGHSLEPPPVRAERSHTGQDSIGMEAAWAASPAQGTGPPELPFLRKSTVRGAGLPFVPAGGHGGGPHTGTYQHSHAAYNGPHDGFMSSITTAGAGLAPRSGGCPTPTRGNPPPPAGFAPMGGGQMRQQPQSPVQQCQGGGLQHPPPAYTGQSMQAGVGGGRAPGYPPSGSPFRHMPVPGHGAPHAEYRAPAQFAASQPAFDNFSFQQLPAAGSAVHAQSHGSTFQTLPARSSAQHAQYAVSGYSSPMQSGGGASGGASGSAFVAAVQGGGLHREAKPPTGATATPPLHSGVAPIVPTPLHTSALTASAGSGEGGSGKPRGRPPGRPNGSSSKASTPPADLPDDIPLQFDESAPRQPGQVGAYPPAARQKRLERYQAKRGQRVWRRKVKYNVRKDFADQRMRVKGRFVKKDDEETLRHVVQMI